MIDYKLHAGPVASTQTEAELRARIDRAMVYLCSQALSAPRDSPVAYSFEASRIIEVKIEDACRREQSRSPRMLDLKGLAIEDLSALRQMPHLEALKLDATRVTTLQPLVELQKLRWLSCDDTDVVDIEPLAVLPKLEWLSLNRTSVGNLKPIYRLVELNLLKWLSFENTRVPYEEACDLARMSPDGTVFFGGAHG